MEASSPDICGFVPICLWVCPLIRRVLISRSKVTRNIIVRTNTYMVLQTILKFRLQYVRSEKIHHFEDDGRSKDPLAEGCMNSQRYIRGYAEAYNYLDRDSPSKKGLFCLNLILLYFVNFNIYCRCRMTII